MALTKRSLDLKLIDLVRENPILYDPKNENHMNFDQREVVWQRIGDALNKPSTTCRVKWNSLRNNFRKSFKLRRSRRIKAEKMKPLKYHKELGFIIPFLNDEENRQFKNKLSYSDQDSSSNHSFVHSDSSSHLIDYATASKCSRVLLFPSKSETSDSTTVNEYAEKTVQESSTSENTEDSLMDFFVNMARTVKEFPPEKQLEMKAKLFEIVHTKFCRRRWANIRDLLRKRIKLRRTNQEAYPYKYERELSFYIPLVNEKDAKKEPYDDDPSLHENHDKYNILHEVFVEPDNSTENMLGAEYKRAERNVTLDPTDPLDVFLLTIGSTLKKLSPYYMNQAKSKLFQVVQEYELKQIMEIEHRNA